MTINLNKELVSKEGLLRYIKDVDVYRFYTNKEVELNNSMKSPLRKDNNPSFGYFVYRDSNEIFFKDFVLGSGDFVVFVQKLLGLNYFEALSKIATDFDLSFYFHIKDFKRNSKIYDSTNYSTKDDLLSKVNTSRLNRRFRDWKLHDLKFWLDYGIDVDILEKYNVNPIDYIFINDKIIGADKYAYSFTENKDGKQTYKIYQPYNKNYKWLNNHDDSVWQGWEQLPSTNEILIITKSLKDVMSIVNNTDYPAVALQSESCYPKEHIINELHSRFDLIYILYDNDFDKEVNWGQEFSEKLADKFRLFNICINDKYNSKDFSDLIKNIGKEHSKKVLIDMVENYLPF